jgi:hypothetical protein
LRGMMLHQDGSSHRWLPALDQELDLIVTMDDAVMANGGSREPALCLRSRSTR